jgi:sulfite exporter TauE/SafE
MFFWSAIVLGLTGSLHCVGMCGPIALALPLGGETPFNKILFILLYNAGRACTYALLGAVAGLAGMGIALSGYQQLLSIVAGIFILASAFFPLSGKLKLLSPLFFRLRQSMQHLFHGRQKKDLFALGLLNGLLPCGMVYMALAMALASGSLNEAAAFMLLFGFGTFPVMIALPYAGTYVTSNVRLHFRRAVPVLTASLGLLLILRGLDLGIPFISPQLSNPHAACHQVNDNSKNTIPCTGHNSQVTR